MTTQLKPVQALEIDLLLDGVYARYGYDFRSYARTVLTRRIRRMLQLESLERVSELQDRVLHDPQMAMRFVATISAHPTSMFRDPDVYRALRDEVIPVLKTYPFVRIWHAGCSTGEETYSLAILLEEEGLYERCRIYVTDVSDALVERARRGVMPLRKMREHTLAYQQAGGERDFSRYYVTDRHEAMLCNSLKRNLVFSQYDLACDAGFNQFQLIVCRNVLVSFDETLRARAHTLFHSSLERFGSLVLGKRESLRASGYEDRYHELFDGLRVYRKLP